MFLQTCRAIQHAHEKGIIHRDITPGNVLVAASTSGPTIRVIDFGLAKALQPDVQLTEEEMYSVIDSPLGTYLFMSPEQTGVGNRSTDIRTDVYSLGAVLYLLLRAPFLAAVQVTVYAGAIMVLFLFVIMLLGAEKADLGTEPIGWQKPVAILLGIVLLVEGGYVAYRGIRLPDMTAVEATNIGDPVTISSVLFSKYLLPFEIISILLLVAIIGTVVLTRRDRAHLREEA